MSEERNITICKYCGGRVEPINNHVLRCTECTTTQYWDGKNLYDIYTVPIKLSKSLALDSLLMWLKKYLGAPPGMYFDADITWSRLLFLPYYSIVARISGEYTCKIKKASYRGRVFSITSLIGQGEMYRHIDFYASEKIGEFDRIYTINIPLYNINQLEDTDVKNILLNIENEVSQLEIPIEKKVLYRWGDISSYNPIEVNITREKSEIYPIAENINVRHIRRLLSRTCLQTLNINYDFEIFDEYPLYVPIWIFKYKLKADTKEYIGVVEGSTGRILYATYPVKPTTRIGLIGLGLLHIVLGGLLLASSGLGGLAPSIAMLLYSGVYLYRGIKIGKAWEV